MNDFDAEVREIYQVAATTFVSNEPVAGCGDEQPKDRPQPFDAVLHSIRRYLLEPPPNQIVSKNEGARVRHCVAQAVHRDWDTPSRGEQQSLEDKQIDDANWIGQELAQLNDRRIDEKDVEKVLGRTAIFVTVRSVEIYGDSVD